MPDVELPPSYLSFLMWSNGGLVRTGQMEVGFFGTGSIRSFLLGYHVPHHMPMAIPLGLDGSGNFALLDARSPLADNEYPLLVAAAGNLGFEDARPLAPTFEAFCRRTERVEDALLLPPLSPPSAEESAERAARLAAQAVKRARATALAHADAAFRAGDYARAASLLAPHRESLEGSLQLKLRIAEKHSRRG
jgi:hypothetical protein